MDALALVESPDHVCCRYRIDPFVRAALDDGHRLIIEGLARSPLGRFRQFARASRFGVVILQRKLLASAELAWLRHQARRLVFDFDDAVFARDSYDTRGPLSTRRRGRFAQVIAAADRVVAGNEFLAAQAVRAGADPDRVTCIPTCVQPGLYPARPTSTQLEGLQLVWIGSASTVQGMAHRRDLWSRIGERWPSVRLRLICDTFPDLGLPLDPVWWSPESEVACLAGSDVGIAWMPDDLWSRGKCGLKVLQYMAAGLPVVANPVGVHVEMVELERNGFLPNSDDAWIRAIGRLFEDPTLRSRMGAASRALVEHRYSVSAWAGRWLEAVFGPIGRPPTLGDEEAARRSAAMPERRRFPEGASSRGF